MTHRTAARIVGALFIIATVASTVAVLLLQPVIGAPDYLTKASLSENRVATGALFEFINHIAVVGIAVAIYPVLRRFSERLALGYVAARSIEAVLFAVGTLHLLTLVTVSQEFVAAGTPPASHFQTLGGMLLAGHDWDDAALAFTTFSVGALILNYVLYQARLVPRWLSVWGFVGAVLILAARMMVIYGLELSSASQIALDTPIAVQEMAFAVWLIVKGFNATPFASELESRVAL
ncbi:MAG: DUF4386 domain-containing protein [Gemmatimonadota bacterium]|nr:MAG: DUF4386 domain-containing protein [Gemmatimonadota bacterium]